MNEYSDFIIFVDESGDHSLTKINPEYPLFVLAFCIFEKAHYIRDIVPAVLDLKYTYFGHELVILHEREMRMRTGDFSVLMNSQKREKFFMTLNGIMNSADMTIIPVIIDKRTYVPEDASTLYDIATRQGMELIQQFLTEHKQNALETFVVFEGRGKKEDQDLEKTFKEKKADSCLKLDFQCAPKSANIVGLQLVDLVARPIGNQYLHPESAGRAYELLSRRIWAQKVMT